MTGIVATSDTGGSATEENRIRSVYAKRRTREKGRYSLLHPGNLLRIQQVERSLVRELSKDENVPLADCRILDVGCGEGFWLREFARWGANPEHLHGVDLLPERIEAARRLSPNGMTFTEGSAANLQYPDAFFDFVTQFTVFTSVLNRQLRQEIAREMLRVLKPSGRILWFDFHYNNPSNPDVRGIGGGEIRSLFPGRRIRIERVGLAPPLGRLFGKATLLYELLCELPFLCTHHVVSIGPLP